MCPKKTRISLRIQAVWSFFVVRIEHFESKMRTVKILIKMRKYTGWSESSLGAHVREYVFCSIYGVHISMSIIETRN